jgi:acetyltransferase-like isoleucine patch superfamily enzyme
LLKRVLEHVYCRFRLLKMSFCALRKKSLISPFARVSKGGAIFIGCRVTVKKGLLDAVTGVIDLRDGVWLNDGVELSAYGRITVGEGTTIQRNGTINGDVSIGKECLLAPNVFISSASHVHDRYPGLSIREQERRISRDDFYESYNKSIWIGDDVWIGANVVIMPGIKVGGHVVIGANSVVTRDIPVGAIVAGAPAKIIKFRFGFEDV